MLRDAALSLGASAPRRSFGRALAQRITQKLKALRLGDVAIRRNPLFYFQARELLRLFEQADLEQRRLLTRARLAETLRRAAATPYGRSHGDWPMSVMLLLRDNEQIGN